jgi:DNA repair protein RecN (Recombination protein N)
MIKSLYLKDIFLFEEEKIFFEKNLNIITGESGSGKTTILNSIFLILGNSAHSSIIPQDKEKSIIEASFYLKDTSKIQNILKNYNIEITNEIAIRREIFKNNKNRIFINDELININVLKEISIYLLQIVSQNLNHTLLSSRHQLDLLDTFASLNDKVSIFSKNFSKLKKLEKDLIELINKKENQEALILKYNEDLLKIDNVNLQKDEEESLCNDHKLLINSYDILNKIDSFDEFLSNENINALFIFKKFEKDLFEIKDLKKDFLESYNLIKNLNLELNELNHLTLNMRSKIDIDPKRLEFVENRLNEIHKLKKNFGSTYDEIISFKEKIENELKNNSRIDQDIEKIKKEIETLNILLNKEAIIITDKREKQAKILENKITDSLKELNMNNATFEIKIIKEKRSIYGDESAEFLFSSNKNFKPALLKNAASSGELSRVVLSLKEQISKNDDTPCIIFDEIDANVGGTSATIIGEKLKKLSDFMQVITITHFIQVAKSSKNHLLVYKKENDKKAISKVKKLDEISQKLEFNRMIGLLK